MKSAVVTVVLAATVLAHTGSATARTTAATVPTAAVGQVSALGVEAAAAPVFNYRRLVLRFPAERGSVVCESRDIKLAAGWYYWRHEDWHGYSYDERRLYLDAGWYHWKDCIGFWELASSDDHPYYHDTYLRQKATGGYAHLDRTWLDNPHDGPVTTWSQFGSSLRQL